ncbi:hypothetical protein BJX66DRAFT_311826 [Aspergillus keveii]|uniref:Secreted protein n=1 Tax=Aspergillus keveii TaxID=714993 RepID=A0ABR4FUT4_9EURO
MRWHSQEGMSLAKFTILLIFLFVHSLHLPARHCRMRYSGVTLHGRCAISIPGSWTCATFKVTICDPGETFQVQIGELWDILLRYEQAGQRV